MQPSPTGAGHTRGTWDMKVGSEAVELETRNAWRLNSSTPGELEVSADE